MLGGTNVVPIPQDIPFLADPANPTIVMGKSLSSMAHVYRDAHLGFVHQVGTLLILLLDPEVARRSPPSLEVSTTVPGRQLPVRSALNLLLGSAGKNTTLWYLPTTIRVILGLKPNFSHASVSSGR